LPVTTPLLEPVGFATGSAVDIPLILFVTEISWGLPAHALVIVRLWMNFNDTPNTTRNPCYRL
jgi:hypothetical protein